MAYENENIHILVVDDEAGMRDSLKRLLEKQGFTITTAHNATTAFDAIQENKIDLVVCDVVMPDMSGISFLSKINSRIPVIMITAYASIETARRSFRSGAYDYLVKPFEFDELMTVVDQCLYAYDIRKAKVRSSLTLHSENDRYLEMLETARLFAPTDMPILILGESGTGKEVISDYIVENSKRKNEVFSKINCAAIPESLLESEMFGHERGAFTGAESKKIGKFEEANGGTLLFDEIGDMDMALQAKLLRVMQDFTFHRVGGTKKIKVDCRIISASNKDFSEMIDHEKFRNDLFHRLNSVTLTIPPLRERTEDIDTLAHHFLKFYSIKHHRHVVGYTEESLELLKQHRWPGNIRELKNCIERAVVVSNEERISREHLPDSVNKKTQFENTNPSPVSVEVVGDFRKNYTRKKLLDILNQVDGNKSEAAKLLNISRKTLYKWLRECDIRNEYR